MDPSGAVLQVLATTSLQLQQSFPAENVTSIENIEWDTQSYWDSNAKRPLSNEPEQETSVFMNILYTVQYTCLGGLQK